MLRAGSADMSLISFMGRDVDVRWEIVEFEHETRLCGEYALGVRGGRDRYMLQPFGIGATIVEVELGRVHASERVLDEGEGDEC